MINPNDYFDGVFIGRQSYSAFYRNRLRSTRHAKNFKPTHETQAAIDRQQQRKRRNDK